MVVFLIVVVVVVVVVLVLVLGRWKGSRGKKMERRKNLCVHTPG